MRSYVLYKGSCFKGATTTHDGYGGCSEKHPIYAISRKCPWGVWSVFSFWQEWITRTYNAQNILSIITIDLVPRISISNFVNYAANLPKIHSGSPDVKSTEYNFSVELFYLTVECKKNEHSNFYKNKPIPYQITVYRQYLLILTKGVFY